MRAVTCACPAEVLTLERPTERHITPAAFARVFCDDLDLDTQTYAKEVERQIAEQVQEQAGLALYPLRSEEEESQMVEKDLRVIINVRPTSPRLNVG